MTHHSPSPIHRAIDHTSALKIAIQRLRHNLEAGTEVEDERLEWMEQVADELAQLLVELRDHDVPGS